MPLQEELGTMLPFPDIPRDELEHKSLNELAMAHTIAIDNLWRAKEAGTSATSSTLAHMDWTWIQQKYANHKYMLRRWGLAKSRKALRKAQETYTIFTD